MDVHARQGHGRGGRRALTPDQAQEAAEAVNAAPHGAKRAAMVRLGVLWGVHWRTVENAVTQFAREKTPAASTDEGRDQTPKGPGQAGGDSTPDAVPSAKPREKARRKAS